MYGNQYLLRDMIIRKQSAKLLIMQRKCCSPLIVSVLGHALLHALFAAIIIASEPRLVATE